MTMMGKREIVGFARAMQAHTGVEIELVDGPFRTDGKAKVSLDVSPCSLLEFEGRTGGCNHELAHVVCGRVAEITRQKLVEQVARATQRHPKLVKDVFNVLADIADEATYGIRYPHTRSSMQVMHYLMGCRIVSEGALEPGRLPEYARILSVAYMTHFAPTLRNSALTFLGSVAETCFINVENRIVSFASKVLTSHWQTFHVPRWQGRAIAMMYQMATEIASMLPPLLPGDSEKLVKLEGGAEKTAGELARVQVDSQKGWDDIPRLGRPPEALAYMKYQKAFRRLDRIEQDREAAKPKRLSDAGQILSRRWANVYTDGRCFKVREQTDTEGVNVAIALDISSSMSDGNKYPVAAAACFALAQHFRSRGNPATIGVFSCRHSILKHETDLLQLTPGGGTRLAKCLRDLRLTLREKRGKKILIIISDGEVGDFDLCVDEMRMMRDVKIAMIPFHCQLAQWNQLPKAHSVHDPDALVTELIRALR